MTAPTTTSAAPPSTFEDVFAQRWTRMVKLAALTTGSVAIAEEIVQDAFEQLHKNWATIEATDSLVASRGRQQVPRLAPSQNA